MADFAGAALRTRGTPSLGHGPEARFGQLSNPFERLPEPADRPGRSVLGSMNDIGYHYKVNVALHGDWVTIPTELRHRGEDILVVGAEGLTGLPERVSSVSKHGVIAFIALVDAHSTSPVDAAYRGSVRHEAAEKLFAANGSLRHSWHPGRSPPAEVDRNADCRRPLMVAFSAPGVLLNWRPMALGRRAPRT